jgi:hypothetical protein
MSQQMMIRGVSCLMMTMTTKAHIASGSEVQQAV